MIRFDFHCNLGKSPTSPKSGTHHEVTVDDLVSHCKKFNLTHAFVIYNKDSYSMLEESQNQLPNTKLYGLQCMFFDHEPVFGNYPDLSKVEIDSLDPNKPLAVGVKFHSHRGWWNIGGKIQLGLDYSDYKTIGKVLKRLPKSTIVTAHVQGSSKPGNTSHPLSIANWAGRYPHLKFVINHAGCYGPRAFTGRPSAIVGPNHDSMTLLGHAAHRNAIVSAKDIANTFHNVFLDGSNFTYDKAKILSDCTRWAVGTDIPYGDEKYYNFDNELSDWEKHAGYKSTHNGMRHAVDFMEKDIEYLLKVQKRYYNFTKIFKKEEWNV